MHIYLESISLRGVNIAQTSKVRFLGLVLDEKLSGSEQLKSMIVKDNKVAKALCTRCKKLVQDLERRED